MGARNALGRLIGKESLLSAVMSQEIVKVTSKGQLTIPARIRAAARMDKGSYLYMKALGRMVIMKKVDDLSLDDISSALQAIAKEKGLTRALLAKEVERIRSQLWRAGYAQGARPARH